VLNPTTLPPPTSGEDGCLLQAFDAYLARQARSVGTRRKYGEALAAYNRWLNGRAPGTVQANEIDRYLEHWRQHFQHRHGRAPASASYRAQINALRALYAYLDRFDLISDRNGQPLPDPMRKILPPKSEPVANDWLRPAEDQALLHCDGSLQERFLVTLLRWSGLRVSEATNLTLADLDLTPGEQTLTVRHSKTPAGRRTIPLLPELQPLLEIWLKQLASHNLDAPSVPLLSSRHGTPMRTSFAWRLVKRLAHPPASVSAPAPATHPTRPTQPAVLATSTATTCPT
jgi:integrase/recombinase XerD